MCWRLLILCTAAAALRAQGTGDDLLQRASAKVLATIHRLPKFMCVQTVDRRQYEPNNGIGGYGCEARPMKKMRLTTSDRLRLDVAVSAGKEMYSWVSEDRFEDRTLFQLVRNGAVSTGSFASLLSLVFHAEVTQFSYKGVVTEGGRQLAEYEFRVPLEESHYVFTGDDARVTTGYFGSVKIDPKTAELAALTVNTDPLPAATKACESRTNMNYSRVRLNSEDFLLPSRVELHILNTNGIQLENATVYSGCHEFLGESTLQFDDPVEPPAAGADSGTAAKPGEVPPGLQFSIALNEPVNAAKAAAGDKVLARLLEPLLDANHRRLAPAGATVALRLLQVRRFYIPASVVRLTVKPESVEIGGVARNLQAQPGYWPAMGRFGPHRRFDPERADLNDPHAAVFEIRVAKDAIVPAFASTWSTAAAQ